MREYIGLSVRSDVSVREAAPLWRLSWVTDRLTGKRTKAHLLVVCLPCSCKFFAEAFSDMKRVPLLIIDDFMTTPIKTINAIDLFEVMEAREGRCATLISSQLEPHEWYLRIDGELMADSILSRIATGATFIDIQGPNMREHLANLAKASAGPE